MTDLVFSQSASGVTTALVFGADDGPSTHFDLTLTGTLPGLTFAARVSPVARVTLTGVFGDVLTLSAAVSYYTNTSRPTVYQSRTFAQVAVPTECGVLQPEPPAVKSISEVSATWTDAQISSTVINAAYDTAQRTDTPQTVGFSEAARIDSPQLRSTMQEGDHRWLRFFSRFQEADRLAAARLTGQFEDGLKDRRPTISSFFGESVRLEALRYHGSAGAARPVVIGRYSRFQEAWVPRPGQYVPPVTPPVVPEYWGPDLLFKCPPGTVHLVFGYDCTSTTGQSLFAILPARFYMTAHSIYAQRLPDLADIPIFEASIAADSGSYCWSLSASGPGGLFDLLAPVDGLPAQIKLTLNGIPWVFAIDSISRNVSFGKTGSSIQGRSVTALIAAPYLRSEQRIEPDEKTAQQLAIQNLAGTGIGLDWGIGAGALANGGMIDWTVPAGAYSRQGTALEAVSRIVQAAGGYLQSHRSLPTLLARHPYGQRIGDNPGAPWGWMIGPADVELAPDALITESIERQDGPDINAVYVSGTSHGVLALVKRTGSAADKLANMVTDSLITHVDCARQAGLAVLGAAGHKYAVRLDLPVLTGSGQPGVLDVGQLVQVNVSAPWRARVRSVSVSAKRPSLRQTVTLEKHSA